MAVEDAVQDTAANPKKTTTKRKSESTSGDATKSAKRRKTRTPAVVKEVESLDEMESFDLDVSSASDTDIDMEK